MTKEDWEFLVEVFDALSFSSLVPANTIKAARVVLDDAKPPEPVAIGIDIDGTIDECPEFFSKLSNAFADATYILTGRDPEDVADTAKDLSEFGISFDTIHHAENWEDKAKICQKHKIRIMFEDQDEYIEHIPEDVLVLKVRNGGNYDFKNGKWLR